MKTDLVRRDHLITGEKMRNEKKLMMGRLIVRNVCDCIFPTMELQVLSPLWQMTTGHGQGLRDCNTIHMHGVT